MVRYYIYVYTVYKYTYHIISYHIKIIHSYSIHIYILSYKCFPKLCGKLEISLTEDKAFAESSLPFDTSLSRRYQSWSKSRRGLCALKQKLDRGILKKWLAKKGGLLQTFCSPLHDKCQQHIRGIWFFKMSMLKIATPQRFYTCHQLSCNLLSPLRCYKATHFTFHTSSHFEAPQPSWATRFGTTCNCDSWCCEHLVSQRHWCFQKFWSPKLQVIFFSMYHDINYSSTLLPHVTPHMLLLGPPSISLPELDRLEQCRNWLASYKIYQNIA